MRLFTWPSRFWVDECENDPTPTNGIGIGCVNPFGKVKSTQLLYRQNAVYHFKAGRIYLVNCKTHERYSFEDPDAHIRDPRNLRQMTLFVGSSPSSARIDPLEYAGICSRVGALFPGFSIQRAEGCFQSRFEDTLVVQIATREPRKILELAHGLRCFLNQDGIGIAHNGIYQRIRDWSDDDMILEAFNLS